MSKKPDYYEVLGLKPGATPKEIQSAYNDALMEHHPDMHPPESKEEAKKKFNQVEEAGRVLTNPDLRRIYDAQGHEGVKRAATDRARPGRTSPGADMVGPVTRPSPVDLLSFFGVRPQEEEATSAPAAPEEKEARLQESRARRIERARRSGDRRDHAFFKPGGSPSTPPKKKENPPPRVQTTPAPAANPVASAPAARVEKTSVADLQRACAAFSRAVQGVAETDIPVEFLEQMRDALQGMASALDAAVQRAQNKGKSPRP